MNDEPRERSEEQTMTDYSAQARLNLPELRELLAKAESARGSPNVDVRVAAQIALVEALRNNASALLEAAERTEAAERELARVSAALNIGISKHLGDSEKREQQLREALAELVRLHELLLTADPQHLARMPTYIKQVINDPAWSAARALLEGPK